MTQARTEPAVAGSSVQAAVAGSSVQAAIKSVADFLSARLEARDEDRLWTALSLLLALVPAYVFLELAFARADRIENDARQFLSWMGRWNDPALLAGDLIADYWSDVSPWAYDELFHAAWAIGIEPVLFTKILPLVLFPLTALFAYRFLRAIRADPLIAFVGTACALSLLAGNDNIMSGTPRAFWPVLLFALMEGLARARPLQTGVAQLLLTGMYPQMALVTATVIGLTLLKPSERFCLDLGRARIVLVAFSAVATIAGLLPFLLSTSAYGPSFSLEEARAVATFQPGGRGAIFQPDGSIDLICNERTGFMGRDCDGQSPQRVLIAGMLLGPVVLLFRSLTGRREDRMASPLPFYLLLSSVFWFCIAAATMFSLHLPSRYANAVSLLPMISAVPVVAGWIRNALPLPLLTRGFPGRAVLIAGAAGALCWSISAMVRPPAELVVPRSPALIEALKALPGDDVVAGFVPDLDFVPVFAGRSVLFTREHAVAYQKGYFLQMMARLAAMRDIFLTRDPAIFSTALAAHRLDWFLVGEKNMREARILRPFRGFFGRELAYLEDPRLHKGPTVLAQRAGPCTVAEVDDVLMLDAACLARPRDPSGEKPQPAARR